MDRASDCKAFFLQVEVEFIQVEAELFALEQQPNYETDETDYVNGRFRWSRIAESGDM